MPRCLYVVTVEVSPSAEKAWDVWHTAEHMPEVLREPGFLTARKYKDTHFGMGRWSRYVINYELENLSAFERYSSSASAQRLRQEHADRFGEQTRVTRQVLVESTPLLLAMGSGPTAAPTPKRKKPATKAKPRRRRA